MRSLGRVRRPRDRAGARPGASLLELILALVLFGVVGTAVMRALDRQVRLHTSILALLESRVQHAATHEILGVTMRGVSPPAGDLLALSDSAVVFRLPLGGGVTCTLGSNHAVLAPDTLVSGQVLTRLHSVPQVGDTLWLLDEGPTDATIDDRWEALRVTASTKAAGGCSGSSVVAPPDDAQPAWRIDVASPLSTTLLPGAPARLTRRARFRLYRSGPDSWLGFTEWNGTTGSWNTIQPVSGPYLPFNGSTPAASGVALTPRDSTGGSSWGAGLPAVSAIALATRTRTRVPLRLNGWPGGFAPDSLRSVLSMRNAR